MGNNRYSFENGNVKTATEVVSEKSDLYQNLKKHELVIKKAVKDMAKAILSLGGNNAETEIAVNFDDSIIEDTGTKRQQFLQEISQGLRAPWEYRKEFFGETEEEAKANIEEIKKNNPSMQSLLGE